jgi:hypothetical protein
MWRVIGFQAPTASDGATASSQLTDTVSDFVSDGPSQTIAKTIASAAIIDVGTSASAANNTHPFTAASASASTSTAKSAGYKLEGMGLRNDAHVNY